MARSNPGLLLAPADVERARSRLDVIAADVALRPAGGRELQGLCPFHAEKTPSFRVVPAKGFFHCFGCGAHGNAIDYMMRSRNLDFVDAVHALNGTAAVVAKAAPVSKAESGAPPPDRGDQIIAVLSGCTPITDRTPAYLYLWARGIWKPSLARGALFAHPALQYTETCDGPGHEDPPWRRWEGNDGWLRGRTLPALVAPFTDSAGVVTALLRIYLSDGPLIAGEASDNRAQVKTRKKGMGRMGDGAIRLQPLDRVETSLGLAEGVETGLAIHQAFNYPTWACGGTARFGFPAHWRERRSDGSRPRIWIPPDRPPATADVVQVEARSPTIWIPPHIERVIVYGDNGETGRAVANHAAAWWRREGRDLSIAQFPDRQHGDWNDQLLGDAA